MQILIYGHQGWIGDQVIEILKNNEKISKHLKKNVEKNVIFVPNRIINFIIKK